MLLKKICSPTQTRALGKNYRLWRSKLITSNGFWAISTACEPKWLARLKETGKPPKNINKVVNDAKKSKRIELEVDYNTLDISVGDPMVTLTDKSGKKYYLNAYYVAMFDSIKMGRYSAHTKYFATDKPAGFKPIVVEALGSFIGVIMPINK